jgi:broad specificity phosphatase PhoE
VEVNRDATRLLLIRHAHVDTGKDGQRMCGWLDLPLSPTGELQLKRFHDQFSEFKPQALYASSSARARATAETLASYWGLDLSIDPQLREINCGTLEGMQVEEVKHRYPELWAENALQNNSDFAWPNGETYTNFRRRIFMALSRIAGQHSNARIAVVTHTGAIAQVVGAIESLSPAVWERYRPAPFTATEVIWSGDAPVQLLSFNVSDWWREAQQHAE